MLFHHGNTDYNTAASEAASFARARMETMIERGKNSAQTIVQRVMEEVPSDAIVRAEALRFKANGNPDVEMEAVGQSWRLHHHAFNQVSTTAGIPQTFSTKLAEGEDWQKELLSHNLNTIFNRSEKRHLVRSINGQARGFLSDRFLRLDARPMLESFLSACSNMGAVPCDGTGSDVRVALRAILPTIFEPVDNEVLCLGVQFKTSDYGAGRLVVSSFIVRLWCTNKASLEDSLARVHLGKQLPEEIMFSERTYQLDTEACVSAIDDVVKNLLSPVRVNTLCQVIKDNADVEIKWGDLAKEMGRRLPTRADLEAVKTSFEGEQDVMLLPERKTRWRLSNCISLLAGSTTDADKKLELERLAGATLKAA